MLKNWKQILLMVNWNFSGTFTWFREIFLLMLATQKRKFRNLKWRVKIWKVSQTQQSYKNQSKKKVILTSTDSNRKIEWKRGKSERESPNYEAESYNLWNVSELIMVCGLLPKASLVSFATNDSMPWSCHTKVWFFLRQFFSNKKVFSLLFLQNFLFLVLLFLSLMMMSCCCCCCLWLWCCCCCWCWCWWKAENYVFGAI